MRIASFRDTLRSAIIGFVFAGGVHPGGVHPGGGDSISREPLSITIRYTTPSIMTVGATPKRSMKKTFR